VIGIGSGPFCDGQVLVTQDILGCFTDFTPKFVKKYADTGNSALAAVRRFRADVSKGKFPGRKNYF